MNKKKVPEPDRRCGAKDCKNFAIYKVIGKLWALNHPQRKNNFARMDTNIGVCELHKSLPTPETIFIEEGRQIITNGFISMNKRPPDFSTAQIFLETIVRGKR